MSATLPPSTAAASAPVPNLIAQAPSDYPQTLGDLLTIRGSSTKQAKQSNLDKIRKAAIEEASEIFGAQSGYCSEIKSYDLDVVAHQDTLQKVFNFGSIMLDGGRVLPPIIEQEDQTFYTSGSKYAVTTQKVWKIVQDPMIVSAAPDWRQYLYLTCTPPNRPNALLLPVSASDVDAWTEGAKKGWAAGVKQAQLAEKLGLHRLTRDYAGMLEFYKLYERNLVSAPILATGHTAVVLNGHTMSVGQTIFRLTATTGFNAEHAAKTLGSQVQTTP